MTRVFIGPSGGGGGGGVSSFNGRSGIVVPAGGDYTAAQVGAIADSRGSASQDVLVFNGSSFVRLPVGAPGQQLVVGLDGNLAYATPAAAPPVTSGSVSPSLETGVPLGTGATYTGPWIDLGAAGGVITVTSHSDHSGTLSLDDSVNMATVRQLAAAPAGSAASLHATTLRQFVRVVYLNGATAQGSMEIVRVLL